MLPKKNQDPTGSRLAQTLGEPNHFMRIRHSSAPTAKQAKLLEQTDAVNFVTFNNPIIIIPVYLCITSRVNGAGAASFSSGSTILIFNLFSII
jgi:hypothetical protein